MEFGGRFTWNDEQTSRCQAVDFPIWHLKTPKKKPPTFHYTGWLIGILIMVYYNPYISGQYNPLYNQTNQGFFHCSVAQKYW